MSITIILEGTKLKNSEIEELSKRTIILLEQTKKQYKTYEEQRKILYSYLVNKNDAANWRKYLDQLEEVIKVKN